jgi:hypothetical protein
MRQVRGVLFSDYVRMMRGQKGVDWSGHLQPEDLPYLKERIEPNEWYPMATFERLGNAILKVVAQNDLKAVKMWGRFQVDQLRVAQPTLVAPRDPVETLTRFRILRSTYFDFEALTIPMLHDDEAHITIAYYMGMPAEEAASLQTLGFFERLLELSGASGLHARFKQRSWAGDPRTLLELRWEIDPARARLG